jgi:hypothetical protein
MTMFVESPELSRRIAAAMGSVAVVPPRIRELIEQSDAQVGSFEGLPVEIQRFVLDAEKAQVGWAQRVSDRAGKQQ